MARNFYKRDGSYYYSDNNQKIYDIPELQAAAQAGGVEESYNAPQSSGARDFYKKGGSYYYADNNQRVSDVAELQAAARAGGKEISLSAPQSSGARDFYKKGGSYYYADNNQRVSDVAELQAAARAGGKEIVGGGTGARNYSQEEIQDEIGRKTEALNNNPITSKYISYGNTAEDIANAFSSGDWSNITDETGAPFSIEIQQEALAKAKEMDAKFYEQQKKKETADAESSLAQSRDDYQNYLINSGQLFEADKSKADQKAADQGVLFSGSRVQKEKNLARAYEQDQSYTRNKVARNIGDTAQDYQYKYGTEAASGLNKYYNLGGNTFNPNVARGGVGQSSLSSVYTPSNYNYAGTRVGEQAGTANKQAGLLLKNRGNKLLASGYQNQL